MTDERDFLPPPIRKDYECLSILKDDETQAVYILRKRGLVKKALLKQARSAQVAELMKNECAMLKRIHGYDASSEAARSFPAVLAQGKENGFWFVREWISGHTLDELTETAPGEPGLGRASALNCLISVTEKLCFLHGLTPPVVHRDIKPQNIVVTGYGDCIIIDFGISRSYRCGKPEDTLIAGTRATAPPEQFGFRQTDVRADVYACGVLLRYTLTGEYEETADERIDADLRAIIRKATMFDPDQRYQTAAEMLRDLIAARFGNAPPMEKKRRRLAWICVAALGLIMAAAAVLAVPEARRALLPHSAFLMPDAEYTFREPLIEEAVRAALMKPEGAVTQQDLAQVTVLRIYGRQVFQYEEQFWLKGEFDYCRMDSFRESGLWTENGGISSLEDILHMPNLRELSLYNQQIYDIEALRGTQISRLGLAHNPLSNLEPLRSNPNIRYLNISCLPLTNLNDVATLKGLTELNISCLHINSIEQLTALPLKSLLMHGITLRDIWELQRLEKLEVLEIQNLDREGLEVLAHLNHLVDLTVTHPLGLPLKSLETLNLLERLYFYGAETPVPEEGVVALPNLRSLNMFEGRFPHFKWLAGLPALRELIIIDPEYESVEGLDSAPLLTRIACGQPMADDIRKAYPDAFWVLQ